MRFRWTSRFPVARPSQGVSILFLAMAFATSVRLRTGSLDDERAAREILPKNVRMPFIVGRAKTPPNEVEQGPAAPVRSCVCWSNR